MRIINILQDYLGKIYWGLFIYPGLSLSKRLHSGRSKSVALPSDGAENSITLDLLKVHHKALWRYLQAVFKLGGILQGIVGRGGYYDRLLYWNKKVPLIGYSSDKTPFGIHLLLEQVDGESEGRSWDMTSLSWHKIQGKFQIIKRESASKTGNEEVSIKCVWISGERRGRIFSINRMGNTEHDNPSAIYYPPKFIVFIFELFISASAVFAFYQLTKDGFDMLNNLIIDFYNWVINLFR